MPETQIITLIIAILGVLHGPVTSKILAAFKSSPPPK